VFALLLLLETRRPPSVAQRKAHGVRLLATGAWRLPLVACRCRCRRLGRTERPASGWHRRRAVQGEMYQR
jgi:hypothetical protein